MIVGGAFLPASTQYPGAVELSEFQDTYFTKAQDDDAEGLAVFHMMAQARA